MTMDKKAQKRIAKIQKRMRKDQRLFRRKVWLPAIVVVAAVALFVNFMLDSTIQMVLESSATTINGAEVNIGNLETSFGQGSLEISKIEVTDKSQPELNVLEIGKVRFALSGSALLAAKVVIDDASIKDIQLGTRRKTPGKVIPPSAEEIAAQKEAEKESGAAELEALKKDAIARLTQAFNLQELKDLKNLKLDDLPSVARAKALKDDFSKKKEGWNGTIAALPQKKDFASDLKEVQSFKPSQSSKPADIKKGVDRLSNLKAKAQTALGDITKKGDGIKEELTNYSKDIRELNKMVDQDTAHLKSKLKLPELDFENLAKEILGPEFAGYYSQAERYFKMAKGYMDSSSSAESAQPEIAAVPQRQWRAKGRDYFFGREGDSPSFWLKRMAINSKESDGSQGGSLAGELTNATTAPKLVGQPTRFMLAGDFKKSAILGLDLKVTSDHLGSENKEALTLKVDSFPLSERSLAKSEELTLTMSDGQGRLDLNGGITGAQILLQLNLALSRVTYQVSAKSQKVEKLLIKALKSVDVTTIEAKGEGALGSIKWTISSNVADAIGKSFTRELRGEFDRVNRELKRQVENRIAEERGKLQAEFDKTKSEILGEVTAKQREAEIVKNEAQKRIDAIKQQADAKKRELEAQLDKKKQDMKKREDAAKKKAEKKAKGKAEEKAKDLLKGVKF